MVKHQHEPDPVAPPPSPRLGLAVVIPCRDEPDLVATLEALSECERPECDAEIIVVINASTVDPPAVRARNRQTLAGARAWAENRRTALQARGLGVLLMHFPDLPARHAGVGLARKLGMDTAADRLRAAGTRGGVIACLDADCRCDRSYLRALAAHFRRHPRTPGCAVYFEHPLDDVPEPRARRGIVCYELYLRYYVQGLRYSGFPYAFHTVGSCMAVREEIYRRQGGMNRRQAGEDFYFLQKIIRLGGFTDLRATRVLPAARASHRVPFGTGRAMSDWLQGTHETRQTYPPRAFADLAQLTQRVDDWHETGSEPDVLLADLPGPLAEFLSVSGFRERIREIRANAATPATFRRRCYHWFNAFRAFKYLRRAAEQHYGTVPVEAGAATLLAWRGIVVEDAQAEALLGIYRRMDREGWFEAPRF